MSVPSSFWTSDQAHHGYLKEFGQKAIDTQKAILRETFGPALYDREDVRAQNINVPRRHIPEDSLMGPLKQVPRRVAPALTLAQAKSMLGGQGKTVPPPPPRTYNGLH